MLYQINTTDETTTGTINCQYRGASYRVEPTAQAQPQPRHLQYRGISYQGNQISCLSRLLPLPKAITTAIACRIEQIASSGIPLTEDPGIIEPMQWLVQTLIGQLKPLLARLVELMLKVDQYFTSFADSAWFAALSEAENIWLLDYCLPLGKTEHALTMPSR